MNGELGAWLLWLSEGTNLETWTSLSPERRSETLNACGLDEQALIEQIAASAPVDPASPSLIRALWTTTGSHQDASNALKQLLLDPDLKALAHLAGGSAQRMSWPGQSIKHNLIERQERYNAEIEGSGSAEDHTTIHEEKEFINENHIISQKNDKNRENYLNQQSGIHFDIEKNPYSMNANGTRGYTDFQVSGRYWYSRNLISGYYTGSGKPSRGRLTLVVHANVHGKIYSLDYVGNNGSVQLKWGTDYQHEASFNLPSKATARELLISSLYKELSTKEKLQNRVPGIKKAYRNLLVEEIINTGNEDIKAAKSTQQTIHDKVDATIKEWDDITNITSSIQPLNTRAIEIEYRADKQAFQAIGVDSPMISFLLAERLSKGYFGIGRMRTEQAKQIRSDFFKDAELFDYYLGQIEVARRRLAVLDQTYKKVLNRPTDVQQWFRQAQQNNVLGKEKTKTGIHTYYNHDPNVRDPNGVWGYTSFASSYRDWNQALWGNFYGSLNPSKGYLNLVIHASVHGKQYNLSYIDNNGSVQAWWGSDYQYYKTFTLPTKSTARSAVSSVVEKLNQRILENRLETKLEKKYEPALMKSLFSPGSDARLLQLDLEINQINRRIKSRWAKAKSFTKNTQNTIENQFIKPATSIKINDQDRIRTEIQSANSIINSPLMIALRNHPRSLGWLRGTPKEIQALRLNGMLCEYIDELRWDGALSRLAVILKTINHMAYEKILHIGSKLPQGIQRNITESVIFGPLSTYKWNHPDSSYVFAIDKFVGKQLLLDKPWKKLTNSFAKGGRFYTHPDYNWSHAKKKWKKGNHTVYSNNLKEIANLASNRTELFYRSEDQAIISARSTFQHSIDVGDSKKEALANADVVYVDSLKSEDRSFIKDNEQRFQTLNQKEYDAMVRSGMWLRNLKSSIVINNFKYYASAGDIILGRQIKISKKLWNDEHHRFGKLRAEALLLKLSAEYAVSQQYQVWFASHPYKQYHPVDKWFKGAWHDLVATVTLPYRAVKSEVKAWKSGAGFIQGLDAGWKTTKQTMKHDIKGLNRTIKGFEYLLGDIFSWIPGYKYAKDAVQVINVVGKSLEKLPDHILKNFETLDKQVIKILAGNATWTGVWDGLGRDTKSFRKMLHRLNWLRKNRFHPKKLWHAVDHHVTEAKKVATIYFHKQEIQAAFKIKRHEYKFAKRLHQDSNGLVRSPLHILGKEYFKGHHSKEQIFLEYKNSAGKQIMSAKEQLKADVDLQISTYKALPKIKQASLDLKLAADYQSKTLRSVARKYEVHQLDPSGKSLDPAKTKSALIAKSQKEKQVLNQKAKHWVSDGGLVQWAIQVDRTTLKDLNVVSSHGGDACLAYELYKTVLKPYEALDERGREAEQILDQTVSSSLGAFIHAIKRFRRDVKVEWRVWGHQYAKRGLGGYEEYLRPQFTVKYGPKPSVECAPLSVKESKQITAKWSSRQAGQRAFTYLMVSYALKNLGASGRSQVIKDAQKASTVAKNWDAIESILWQSLNQSAQALETTYQQANPLLQRLVLHALKNKEERFSTTHKALLVDAKYLRYNLIKVEDQARKAFKEEVDLLKVLALPVSDFNKTSYHAFEDRRFSSIKLLELQAALSYDFTKTGKKDESNVNLMVDTMKKNDPTVYGDLKTDKQIQTVDQDSSSPSSLTLGQVLVSTMPKSSETDDQRHSDHSDAQHQAKHATDVEQNLPPKANLWMLYRNYKVIKHWGKKEAKKGAEGEGDLKETEQKAANDAENNLDSEQKAKLEQIDQDVQSDDLGQKVDEQIENNLEDIESDWSRETIRLDRQFKDDEGIVEEEFQDLGDDLTTETEDLLDDASLRVDEETAELEGDFDDTIIDMEGEVDTTIAEADAVIDETLESVDELILGA